MSPKDETVRCAFRILTLILMLNTTLNFLSSTPCRRSVSILNYITVHNLRMKCTDKD